MTSLPSSTSGWIPARPEPASSAAARTAAQVFTLRFGRAPRWLAVAPGRVNLIGEHTDYSGGYVLPLAIDRQVVIAAAPAAADSGRVRAYSASLDASVDIRLDGSEVPGEPAWANYLRGVVSAFGQRGLVLPPIDAAIISDVPLGGGLSSSAALEVAMATLLEAVTGAVLEPREKARLCRQAEHEFAGVPCGLMDQLASVMGDEAGALLIDCRFEVVRVVPFADPDVSVLVCNTNVKHALADGAYARRRTECAEAARQLGVPTLRDATPAMVEAARGSSIRPSGGGPATSPQRTCAHWRRLPTWRRASSSRSARSCTRATGPCATTSRSARPSSTRWWTWRERLARRVGCSARE